MKSAAEPTISSDTDLSNRVSNYFFSLNRPSLRELSIEVSQGEVILSGRLPSYYEKSLALNACQRVAGVIKLCDTIEIDE